MMTSPFDKIVPRKGTDSLKYDSAARKGIPENALPLWVADMDFRAPDEVLDALERKIGHGIFGYSECSKTYFDTLKSWMGNRFSWAVRPEWLIQTPGVVFAVSLAIRALTESGDAVIVQQPVYAPIFKMVENNNRKLIVNQLKLVDNTYEMDLDDFEAKIVKHQVRLFILCSPHNPVGRVWTKSELTAVGEICLKYGVYICSDEIHADFAFPGYKHEVFANLSDAFSDITITCTAPSKTFNLAGLQISNIFISNSKIRAKFKREMQTSGYSQIGVLGLIACESAYQHGQVWLDQLKDYLSNTYHWLDEYLKSEIPNIRLIASQGTYLIWLDCRQLHLPSGDLDHFLLHRAGIWLSAGTAFGKGGAGFQRMNIASPRSVIQQAAHQLQKAVDDLTSQKPN